MVYTLSGMAMPKIVSGMTPEEYYRLEELATEKSDYYQGEIFGMAGGSIWHSRISSNIIAGLHNGLVGKDCRSLIRIFD